jgi:hypothetical protein
MALLTLILDIMRIVVELEKLAECALKWWKRIHRNKAR